MTNHSNKTFKKTFLIFLVVCSGTCFAQICKKLSDDLYQWTDKAIDRGVSPNIPMDLPIGQPFPKVFEVSSEVKQRFREYIKEKIGKDVDTYVESSWRLNHPEFAGLTNEELIAINQYTDTSYQFINSALRGQEWNPIPQATWDLIQVAVSGLKKLQPYTGTVYRGANLRPERIEEYRTALASGTLIEEKPFFSTSTEYIDGFEGNVSFEIEPLRGVEIKALSIHWSEKEVLMLPYSKFKILDIVAKSASRVIIKMKEVPD